MKNLTLAVMILVGLYTLARNNLGQLPGQLIWITHPNFFYKVFIPLLLVASSASALINKKKENLFLLSLFVTVADAINRLSEGINHFHLYLIYGQPPKLSGLPPGEMLVVYNMWPSYIIGGIEILLICVAIKYLSNKITIVKNS